MAGITGLKVFRGRVLYIYRMSSRQGKWACACALCEERVWCMCVNLEDKGQKRARHVIARSTRFAGRSFARERERKIEIKSQRRERV